MYFSCMYFVIRFLCNETPLDLTYQNQTRCCIIEELTSSSNHSLSLHREKKYYIYLIQKLYIAYRLTRIITSSQKFYSWCNNRWCKWRRVSRYLRLECFHLSWTRRKGNSSPTTPQSEWSNFRVGKSRGNYIWFINH